MKEEYLMIMVSKEFKKKVKEKAESEYKNMSEYVRDLIVRDIKGE